MKNAIIIAFLAALITTLAVWFGIRNETTKLVNRPGRANLNGELYLANAKEVSFNKVKRPVVVWLVAGGCASCAVSFPVMSNDISKINKYGVSVLVLGLSGAFDNGQKGVSELLQFAQYAGANVDQPGWTFALASLTLSYQLDPQAVPDKYLVISKSNKITYSNTIVANTNTELLIAVSKIKSE